MRKYFTMECAKDMTDERDYIDISIQPGWEYGIFVKGNSNYILYKHEKNLIFKHLNKGDIITVYRK